ncbi:hypothetical protein KFL_001800190 [Klebsormidium nitens]|uniref:Uncharacterized protein n=1 Tax=Klebsormidium nitens TaxID=105231 RepID=A0A1Y1I4W7_KLENI|nr:hypothetical protein KFL_001800190 [Klebsormidium nitens]|eukprot:GAQ84211.1 hypothetical protein KFL_001800190 [Klebsormidium nitens]
MASSQVSDRASSELRIRSEPSDDPQSVRTPRTTSNTALLQQVGDDEAVFEVPKEASAGLDQHLDAGGGSEGKVHPEEGPGTATHAGLSGLLRGPWRDLAGGGFIFGEPYAPLKTLFAFQGTALKMVLTRVDFWILILLNLAVNLVFYTSTSGHTTNDTREEPREYGWPGVNITMIGTSGALLSFFLVFFNNESYKRFFDQYRLARNTEHAISNLVLMLRTNFRDGLIKHAATTRLDIFRYLSAAHYLGLAHLPQYKSDGMVDWAYAHLQSLQVLSSKEVDVLRALPGRNAYKECLLWCLQRLWVHTENKDIESRIYQAYERNVLDVRKSIQDIYNYTSQPIPFAYFHLINFLLLVYLAVNAYAFAFFSAYWSLLGYAVFTIALLGLRELGVALADPFGDDETDLPIFSLINEYFEENEKALNDPPLFAPELD